MPHPTPQELATQLEAYRITVAIRDSAISILTSDLARANVAKEELRSEIESLKNPPKPADQPQD